VSLPQKLVRLQAEAIGVTLQSLEGDVALTAFQSADVGPVYAEDVGESLLGQAAFLPVLPKVLAERSLEFSLHGPSVLGLLLEGLQTYK
jgi:hypothetical protein